MCGKAARSEQLECKGLITPWEKQLSGHDVCPARLLLESKKQSWKYVIPALLVCSMNALFSLLSAWL